jgi:putative hydrolase
MSTRTFNQSTATILRDCAELLRQQKANPFRTNAYLRAADTLESISVDARDILREEGVEGLENLPAIGKGLAASISEIAQTGRLSQLERLRGAAEPEKLFQTLPGIGPALAHEIHDRLHVDTLEALEIAAHDGRLASLKGIGPRRVEAVRSGLASLLARASSRRRQSDRSPAIDTLLHIDQEYRDKAEVDALPKIAPRRFNPEERAWLPIMHTDRDGWHFTALFSNTARAHKFKRTHDWVVVYFYDGEHREGQCTIVTETRGPLTGQRVVRGREAECRRRLLA